MHHADCAQCCQIGRCHFCGASGPVAAHFTKDSEQYAIRLCPTHYSWAATNKNAPPLIFDEAFLVEQPPEPVRQSESFQSTVLQLAGR